MGETLFVTGGCRSGKSRYALAEAERMGPRRLFVATLEPGDAEMADRIRRHREERGPEWTTLEAPRDLAAALAEHRDNADVILVDCLTLWVTNLLLDGADVDAIAAAAEGLCREIGREGGSLVFVSNEVGSGVVPDNRLGRDFRDAAGMVNRLVAAACGRAVMLVAGLPVTLK